MSLNLSLVPSHGRNVFSQTCSLHVRIPHNVIQTTICSFLDIWDTVPLMNTCWNFRNIVQDKVVWRKFILYLHPDKPVSFQSVRLSYIEKVRRTTDAMIACFNVALQNHVWGVPRIGQDFLGPQPQIQESYKYMVGQVVKCYVSDLRMDEFFLNYFSIKEDRSQAGLTQLLALSPIPSQLRDDALIAATQNWRPGLVNLILKNGSISEYAIQRSLKECIRLMWHYSQDAGLEIITLLLNYSPITEMHLIEAFKCALTPKDAYIHKGFHNNVEILKKLIHNSSCLSPQKRAHILFKVLSFGPCNNQSCYHHISNDLPCEIDRIMCGFVETVLEKGPISAPDLKRTIAMVANFPELAGVHTLLKSKQQSSSCCVVQ